MLEKRLRLLECSEYRVLQAVADAGRGHFQLETGELPAEVFPLRRPLGDQSLLFPVKLNLQLETLPNFRVLGLEQRQLELVHNPVLQRNCLLELAGLGQFLSLADIEMGLVEWGGNFHQLRPELSSPAAAAPDYADFLTRTEVSCGAQN